MRSHFAGILVVTSANKITKVKIQTHNLWNRHQAQYLIINALETLELLEWRLYDEETGFWRIQSLSPVLPIAGVRIIGDEIHCQGRTWNLSVTTVKQG